MTAVTRSYFGAKVLGYNFKMAAIPDDVNVGKDHVVRLPSEFPEGPAEVDVPGQRGDEDPAAAMGEHAEKATKATPIKVRMRAGRRSCRGRLERAAIRAGS